MVDPELESRSTEGRHGRARIRVFPTPVDMAVVAAGDFAAAVARVLESRDEVGIIFASAPSQLPFLQALRRRDDIAWLRVHVLHMDEYLGMSAEHPASFRRFLQEQLISWAQPAAFHPLNGDAVDIDTEIERYSELLRHIEPSICVLGIGENGHLAFNDPPADFNTHALVHLVELDTACRRQQWQEGHFGTLDEVPSRAVSLTVPALLRPQHVLCVAPDARKAAAVKAAFESPVSPACPASGLQTVDAMVYLDVASASLLQLGSTRPPQIVGDTQ